MWSLLVAIVTFSVSVSTTPISDLFMRQDGYVGEQYIDLGTMYCHTSGFITCTYTGVVFTKCPPGTVCQIPESAPAAGIFCG